ncbi:MAG TPA: hypothetical protein VLZ75_07730 [Chitinophagales bacterium]|nr:hypothetical protein [Chitinophagales bacterium]
MKNIIKTFTIGAILFSTALIPLNAQNGMGQNSPMNKNYKSKQDYKNYTPEEKAQKITDKIAYQLQLTESQKKEVYNMKLEDIKRREVMRNSQKEYRNNSENNFRKILTPEQIIKLDELKNNKEGYRGYKGQNNHKKQYGPRD